MSTTDTTATNDSAQDIVIATISRSPSTELRISLRTYRGKRFLDLRVFTSTGDADAMVPTSKGCTIAPALLGQLKRAVDKALDEALRLEWIE